MRTGALLSERPAGCSLQFLNGEHIAIAAQYVQLGMITFSGSPEGLASVQDSVPAAVAVAACKLGGDSVSLNAAMGTVNTAVVQFLVWHNREALDSSEPSEPPTEIHEI